MEDAKKTKKKVSAVPYTLKIIKKISQAEDQTPDVYPKDASKGKEETCL